MAAWLKSLDQVNAEDFWSLVWYDAEAQSRADRATASPGITFRITMLFTGAATGQQTRRPLHLSAARRKAITQKLCCKTVSRLAFVFRPCASGRNSFIIFAGGQYLTGDTGYAGVPMTEHHNTMLIGRRGAGA